MVKRISTMFKMACSLSVQKLQGMAVNVMYLPIASHSYAGIATVTHSLTPIAPLGLFSKICGRLSAVIKCFNSSSSTQSELFTFVKV